MDETFLLYVAIGFAAQLVDGALGMAYGVTATSLLLSVGVSPVMASAAVHATEVATTGFSATSHHFARNVDWPVVRRLALAGCAGGIAGAYLLSTGAGEALRPIVSTYLMLMGLVLIAKAFRAVRPPRPLRRLGILGAVGGFLDAIGGGGWGPIVSSTLLMSDNAPNRMIGSSAAAEFFVTVAITVTFSAHLDFTAFGTIALALVVGALPAAPLAAVLVRVVPRKPLMIAVGFLIVGLGAIGLWSMLA